MAELQVIARYTVTPGNEEQVLELLPRLAEASLAEPGCRSFEIYRRVGDDGEIVLLERYASPEAIDAHRASDHFIDLVLGQIVPLLDRRVVEQYDVPDS